MLLLLLLLSDDTTAYATYDDINLLFDLCNEGLANICSWIKCNRLTVNTAKTVYMIMGTAIDNLALPQITMIDQNITRVDTSKFLGITIDDKSKFNDQINSVLEKLSKFSGILHKIKKHVSKPLLLSLYYTVLRGVVLAMVRWFGVT